MRVFPLRFPALRILVSILQAQPYLKSMEDCAHYEMKASRETLRCVPSFSCVRTSCFPHHCSLQVKRPERTHPEVTPCCEILQETVDSIRRGLLKIAGSGHPRTRLSHPLHSGGGRSTKIRAFHPTPAAACKRRDMKARTVR